jgi:photosystem II stability/assembly factor-like uncharacterized protein
MEAIMRIRWLALPVVVITSLVICAALFWFARETRASVYEEDLKGLADAPHVMGIVPNTAPNDLDTPVVISGTGFTTGLTITLGSTVLVDSSRVSETILTSTIPWGLEPGVYTLTVQNPDGETDSLPSAFTVTQGIGVWTSSGPYGGVIESVYMHPTNPNQLYAYAIGTGLFSSADAGANWELIFVHQTAHMAIDPQQPEVMYITANDGLGRSQDGGATWQNITPYEVLPVGLEYYIYPHPTISGVIYATAFGEPLPGGVVKSTNQGDTWITVTHGLPYTNVLGLAFHPENPDIMMVGTAQGDVYTSTNGGGLWHFAAHLAPALGHVYFNPFGDHEAWALGQVPSGGPGWGVFRSTDPGYTTWEEVTTLPGSTLSLTFHPVISGTIWAGTGCGYVSADNGVTWNPVGSGLWCGDAYSFGVFNFAVDPSITPATPILYAGTGRGFYKSDDGGATWFESDQGLNGIMPAYIAVSPHDPEELYLSTNGYGVFKSRDGGRSWLSLDVPTPSTPMGNGTMAVDPSIPGRIYVSGIEGAYPDFTPVVRISPDRGESWQTITFTLPASLADWGGQTLVVAPTPETPGRILAGVGFFPLPVYGAHPQNGGIYLSQDYGQRWTPITLTQEISPVGVIVYDPGNPQVVYAGTFCGELLKSSDGGDSWQILHSWVTRPNLLSIAVNPNDPNWLVVSVSGPTVEYENGIYVSNDGGKTWTMTAGWVWTLVYDAHDSPILYAGTFNGGLWRSLDNGLTWEFAAGLSVGNIGTIAATQDGERVIVYIGIAGGMVIEPGVVSLAWQDEFTLLGSGVFRLTTILSPLHLYLPLVAR